MRRTRPPPPAAPIAAASTARAPSCASPTPSSGFHGARTRANPRPESVTTSGRSIVSRSVKNRMTRASPKPATTAKAGPGGWRRARARNSAPARSSTRGLRGEIGAPQERHRPRTRQDQRLVARQAVDADVGERAEHQPEQRGPEREEPGREDAGPVHRTAQRRRSRNGVEETMAPVAGS